MSRVLKKGGLFFTVRDHVIYNEKDKAWFLENHPLQKYYGGENAFTSNEYKSAIQSAGLILQKELKFFDSVINYFPDSAENMQNRRKKIESELKKNLIFKIFSKKRRLQADKILLESEKSIPGRMYSYIAIKK